MDTKTHFVMDWGNLQFKAKDILLFVVYLVSAVFFISKITSSVDRQGEKISELQYQITEMKNEGKGSTKDFQVFLQSIQNQVNATNTQVRLLEQRVDLMERTMRNR